jgi:hypothetical protein
MTIRLIVEIAVAVLGLATATVVAMKTIKEAKIRSAAGLKPNPERCKEHADRLAALEGREAQWVEGLGQVKAGIKSIGDNVDVLLRLHLKE